MLCNRTTKPTYKCSQKHMWPHRICKNTVVLNVSLPAVNHVFDGSLICEDIFKNAKSVQTHTKEYAEIALLLSTLFPCTLNLSLIHFQVVNALRRVSSAVIMGRLLLTAWPVLDFFSEMAILDWTGCGTRVWNSTPSLSALCGSARAADSGLAGPSSLLIQRLLLPSPIFSQIWAYRLRWCRI